MQNNAFFVEIISVWLDFCYICNMMRKKIKNRIGILMAVSLIVVLLASCATSKAERAMRKAERQMEKAERRAARNYEKAKAAHYKHQAKKTKKMIKEDRKRARKLNKHRRVRY